MKVFRVAALLAFLPLSVLASDRFDKVLDIVAQHYREAIPREVLEEKALRAFLKDLDPYSNYMNAEEWTELQNRLKAQFGGIGVVLEIDTETKLPRVGHLLFGSAAGEAGVRRGDHLVQIDGHPLDGRSIDEVIPLLRGPAGTTVDVTIRHAGAKSTETLRLQRRIIKSPSVRGVRRDAAGEADCLLNAAKGIGYIRVMNLADDTVPELKKALAVLTRKNMKGLILDLRDSSGGKLRAAADAADLFLDGGRIVSIDSRIAGDEVIDAEPGALTDVPMVMLINEWTVSSSEILAGALADNRRVITMGRRTFGKGRIQVTYALGEGMGGVVLSTGTFQRPSGKTIDKHDAGANGEGGIAPDPGLEIVLDAKESEAWAAEASRLDGYDVLTAEEQVFAAPDRVLDCALEVLEGVILSREDGEGSPARPSGLVLVPGIPHRPRGSE